MNFMSSKFVLFAVCHVATTWLIRRWRISQKHIRERSHKEKENTPLGGTNIITTNGDLKNVEVGGDSVIVQCDNCEMANSAPRVDRHIILCHEGDWPSHLEKEEGSVAYKLMRILKNIETTLAIKLTACDEPTRYANGVPNTNTVDILVYPDGIRYSITKKQLEAFVDCVISPDPTAKATELGLQHSPIGWEKVILVCTHGSRDKVSFNAMYHSCCIGESLHT